MKKILTIILIGFTVFTFAQKTPYTKSKFNDYSPEQQAILQTKRMALNLDLSSSQQKQILKINKKQAVERKKKMETYKTMKENGTKPTSDERFKMINERLDNQLVFHTEMKNILTENQFEQWNNFQKRKMMNISKKRSQDKGKSRRKIN